MTDATQQISPDTLLTMKDIARRWSISLQHVKLLSMKKRMPPAVRFGRRCVRWRLAEILQWEDELVRKDRLTTVTQESADQQAEPEFDPLAQ